MPWRRAGRQSRLTGLSRPGLHKLTQRLDPLQAAQAERFGYQRRGGPRQPSARGGVFHQKISNAERILLAILYQRHLCTMDVLASLRLQARQQPDARAERVIHGWSSPHVRTKISGDHRCIWRYTARRAW
jgi:hypothetical protein